MMVNTSQSTSQCPPSPSWYLTLSGLVLDVQFLGALQALFLINFSSIISSHSVLGDFCCVLQRYMWGSSFSLNEGYNFAVHVSSTMASLMLSRHHSLFLECLPVGCTRGYASCIHRDSSVSPQHALPRAAGGLLVLQRRSHPLRALRV